MFYSKKLFLLPFLFFITFKLFSADIRKIYPDDYEKALQLKKQYEVIFKNHGVTDINFYLALVFPEMIRYNQIKDGLETFINSIAYTTIDESEGCSIGPFQIKPRCALEIENFVRNSSALRNKYQTISCFAGNESFADKYKRVNRLQQKSFQVDYLLAFVDICFEKYNLENESVIEQLRIVSAAYNIGLLDNVSDFDNFLSIDSFPKGRNSPESLWNYTELVIDFYDEFCNS